jgi:hypothetical protein
MRVPAVNDESAYSPSVRAAEAIAGHVTAQIQMARAPRREERDRLRPVGMGLQCRP